MGTRILFICTLVLALTLAAAIPQFGRDGRRAPSGADRGKHSLAINILRAINTAELDHRMKHGTYVTWDELATTQEFTDHGTKWAAQYGDQLAGAHFSKGPEILPSWVLRLDLTNGGQGYDVLLEDTTDKTCGYAVVTDERGIIRQSKAIDCPI